MFLSQSRLSAQNHAEASGERETSAYKKAAHQRRSTAGKASFHEAWIDGLAKFWRDRWPVPRMYGETLRAVDDGLGRIVAALREQRALDSTLIIFTSDNGFQLGEHGLFDKRTMYEPSIRVPLVVHCPELIPAAQRRKEMVLNIDLAPSILEAAGIPVSDSVQGRSFHGLLNGSKASGRATVFSMSISGNGGSPRYPR